MKKPIIESGEINARWYSIFRTREALNTRGLLPNRSMSRSQDENKSGKSK